MPDSRSSKVYVSPRRTAASFVNRPENNHIGTVGQPLSSTQAKIAGDGEILIKGRGVMKGILNNQKATDEGLERTAGSRPATSARSRKTARSDHPIARDIIVTAGCVRTLRRRNIRELDQDALGSWSQAVVHGEKRKYLTLVFHARS